MLYVNNNINENTDWIKDPIIINIPIDLILKYSHKEQKIKDMAKPVVKIKDIII